MIKTMFTPGSVLLIAMFIISSVLLIAGIDHGEALLYITVMGTFAWGMLRFLQGTNTP